MSTATIIGSGPNGLSAAIVLAASGVRTTVLERNGQIGGGCSTAEVTQPGFVHDLGSSTYPWALQALSMVLFPSPFLGFNRTRHSLTRWMTGERSYLNTRLKKQSTNWMHVTAKHTDH
jgi:phytoene dehydrogenase-like protein